MRGAGWTVLEAGEFEVLRRISGETFSESRRKAYYLMSIHEHLPPQSRRQLQAIGSGMEEGVRTSQAGQLGQVAFRLCNLVAQRPSNADGGLKKEVERELTGR
jgi:hypothetical protein